MSPNKSLRLDSPTRPDVPFSMVLGEQSLVPCKVSWAYICRVFECAVRSLFSTTQVVGSLTKGLTSMLNQLGKWDLLVEMW